MLLMLEFIESITFVEHGFYIVQVLYKDLEVLYENLQVHVHYEI